MYVIISETKIGLSLCLSLASNSWCWCISCPKSGRTAGGLFALIFSGQNELAPESKIHLVSLDCQGESFVLV